MIKVFVSHSSKDAELARLLVHLLTSAMSVRSREIRCTSVDGYRLPAGAESDEQLREEALAAECFIGILSPQSLSSAYVLFELGARWGAQKHLIPLLAPGLHPEALRGPLIRLNALSCGSASQLHQLVYDIGSILGAEIEAPAVYQHHIEAIQQHATASEADPRSGEIAVIMPQMGDSVASGVVTKLLVAIGERVSRDQPLFEISTDKVDAEIPSPDAGTVARVVVPLGQDIPVGSTVLILRR